MKPAFKPRLVKGTAVQPADEPIVTKRKEKGKAGKAVAKPYEPTPAEAAAVASYVQRRDANPPFAQSKIRKKGRPLEVA